MRSFKIAAIVALGAVGLDQGLKAQARAAVLHAPSLPLELTLALGLSGVIALWSWSRARPELRWPAAALTAGFASNVIDRLLPGRAAVLDHWRIDLLDLPGFSAALILNLADLLLVAGLLGLVAVRISNKRSA